MLHVHFGSENNIIIVAQDQNRLLASQHFIQITTHFHCYLSVDESDRFLTRQYTLSPFQA